MVVLAKQTTVWPHPEELFLSGNKVHGYEILRVASLSLGLSVPMYAMADELVWTQEFQDKLKLGTIQGVLKRDYSMRGDHVISIHNLWKLRQAVKDQRKAWKAVEGFFGQPSWFVQPFLAHLLYVGETRVFIVGGRIIYKISTTQKLGEDEGLWEVTDMPVIRPLHKHE